jgi:hypothetical protein
MASKRHSEGTEDDPGARSARQGNILAFCVLGCGTAVVLAMAAMVYLKFLR